MPSLPCVVSILHPLDALRHVYRTFFAFSESSVDSMVMYLSPLTLTPFEMTALVSLLSLKEAAMALISVAVSWNSSAPFSGRCHHTGPAPVRGFAGIEDGAMSRITYREVWGRGPGGLAVDIADEGLVDVASADEAARGMLERHVINGRTVYTSGRRMLSMG